jgi:DNA-binding CsgD family transcriptional regulator
MNAKLIDKIYESCFAPEIWPEVLEEMGRIAGGPGASLFVSRTDVLHWTASREPRTRAEQIAEGGWFSRAPIILRLFAERHAGFLIDVEFFTQEELDREPLYRDIWRPQGVGWAMATAIPIPTGENASFVLTRPTEQGPFERASANRLDELRPHLARSVLISARLQLERARVAGQALEALGVPALVFDEAGKVLFANPLIEAMTGHVHWRAFDLVSLKDQGADRLLRAAIAAINRETASGVRSFPIRNAEAEAPMVAHVIPIRLSAREIFLRCAAVLAMTPVGAPRAPPVELVQSLFDLTPAEARVARSLAIGKTVEDIASDHGISPSTVRTHVRGVLEKTGCNRQAEVVALRAGMAQPGIASAAKPN